MRPLIILFFSATVINTLPAQSTNTNYALPANATEVTNTVSDTPGYMLTLQEGGNIPSEAQTTCDGKSDGVYKSSAGFSLQHYYNPEQLKQMSSVYASMGGIKSVFTNGWKADYKDFEKGMHPGPVLEKGPLQTGELQGASVSYFTVKYGCIQSKNATATKTIFKAIFLDENNYLLINIEIYSANADLARKSAEEILTKIKSLDYGKVK